MKTHKTAARTFGIFFIVTFLAYGIGSGLIESIITAPDFLSNVYANQTQIVAGVILMAIVHTFLNIGLPIIMLPILEPHNKRLAYGYLSAAIAATTVLAVGTLFLLLLIPLSDEYVNAGSAAAPYFETMGILFKKGSFYAYHMGMALWAIGGLLLVSVLYKSKLIPQPLSLLGIVGYIVLVAGSILEIVGHNDIVEIISVAPGGLFEITLSIWLIVKGFNSSTIAFDSVKTKMDSKFQVAITKSN
ncbi:MAG: DUF4386 domain-containing protein [Chloroflexi bacterium]|nr:DUF4386 domain-containing protein [Chloroflexota bacterium]